MRSQRGPREKSSDGRTAGAVSRLVVTYSHGSSLLPSYLTCPRQFPPPPQSCRRRRRRRFPHPDRFGREARERLSPARPFRSYPRGEFVAAASSENWSLFHFRITCAHVQKPQSSPPRRARPRVPRRHAPQSTAEYRAVRTGLEGNTWHRRARTASRRRFRLEGSSLVTVLGILVSDDGRSSHRV